MDNERLNKEVVRLVSKFRRIIRNIETCNFQVRVADGGRKDIVWIGGRLTDLPAWKELRAVVDEDLVHLGLMAES